MCLSEIGLSVNYDGPYVTLFTHTLPCEKLYRFPLKFSYMSVCERKKHKVDLHKFTGERVCEGGHIWSIVVNIQLHVTLFYCSALFSRKQSLKC